MGYRSLVTKQVDSAFKQAGDLAVDIVLTSEVSSGYDFVNDAPIAPVAEPELVIKGIKLEESSSDDPGNNTITVKLLVKAEDVGSLDVYDTFTFDNATWKLAPPYKSNGYTAEVTVTRGA